MTFDNSSLKDARAVPSDIAAMNAVDIWFPLLGLPETERLGFGRWRAMADWPGDRILPKSENEPDEWVQIGSDVPHFVLCDGTEILCDGMEQQIWDAREFVTLARGYTGADGSPDLERAWEWLVRVCDGGDPDVEPEQEPESDTRSRLSLTHFDDDSEPCTDDAWLIEDVLPEDGLGVAYGAPGCGKTFVMLDMAFAVSGAVNEWRGKYVEHGSVLYFGMEGGRMFRNRIAAYAKERARAPWFFRSGHTLDLRSKPDDARAIVSEAARIGQEHRPVKLVVVDTLARAMSGGNENAPEDMGAFLSTCEAVRKALGCYLLIVHHCGKDEARGMRGHSSLLGAVDTEIHLESTQSGRVLTITKQRDGEDGLAFGYSLRQVLLGTSPRGKAITSLVVDDAEATVAAPNLGHNQKKTIEALRQYVDEHGRPCPGGLGWPQEGSKLVVPADAFLRFLSDKMTNEKADDRRRSASRAFDSLVGRGLIQINEGKAWLV